MRALVTGGCGCIGCYFIKHMLDTYDYKITNIDKLTYAGKRENLKDYEYPHLLSAIIRHCLSNGHKLDSELNYLLRNI